MVHQILNIQTLQVMDPIVKENLTIQIIVLSLWFFKVSKLRFKQCPSIRCVIPKTLNACKCSPPYVAPKTLNATYRYIWLQQH
jgi:hypothetical protein